MAASAKLIDRRRLTEQVKAAGRDAGFDLVGVAPIGPATHGDMFRAWLAVGQHPPLTTLEAEVDVRTDPRQRRPWAWTVLALGTRDGAAGVPEESAAVRAELAHLPRRPTTPPMPGCDDADPDGWRTRDATYHRINDGRLDGLCSASHCRSPHRTWRRVG
jgi:hypothetical protein